MIKSESLWERHASTWCHGCCGVCVSCLRCCCLICTCDSEEGCCRSAVSCPFLLNNRLKKQGLNPKICSEIYLQFGCVRCGLRVIEKQVGKGCKIQYMYDQRHRGTTSLTVDTNTITEHTFEPFIFKHAQTSQTPRNKIDWRYLP